MHIKRTSAYRSKFHDEPMDWDTLERVKAMGPDGERVVRAYLRCEGALHRLEEWPVHEEHYPEDQRFEDFRELAAYAIRPE